MSILVSAASKHGATAEIAERISARLSARGLVVEHRQPDDVRDLHGYDAVVLGSGVYAGRWLEAARSLVARLPDDLRTRRVWLFSSGPLGDPLFPAGEPEEAAALREDLGAEGHAVFPGRIDKARLGRAERLVLRAVRAPEGDYRDWQAIDSWADSIADALCPHPAA